ncbi:MAG: hypothetical protein IH994_10430 [Proteobacteria bacterium]|nr:hypothetical protein [Pseudomonadota bacterium]
MDVTFRREGRLIYARDEDIGAIVAMEPFQRHAGFHRACRQFYPADRGRQPSDLSRKGLGQYPGLLTAEQAGGISRLAGTLLEEKGPDGGAFGPLPSAPGEANVTVPPDKRMVEAVVNVLDKIFRPQVVTDLEGYLGCYFRIDQASVYRTHPVEKSTISFQWHRDIAPMSQVHLMVYLTPGGDECGATDFLDFQQTQEAAIKGYHYTTYENRTDDIDTVFAPLGKTAEVTRPKLGPGDGLIFAAPRVLHRGWLPKEGFRDAMLFVLLPSMVPWNYEIEDFGTDYVFLPDSKNTLHANPFLLFNPSIVEEKADNIQIPEDWIFLGAMFPS